MISLPSRPMENNRYYDLLRALTVTTCTTIKFTANWSAVKVTFLDTTVYFTENGLIGTDLYVKPTEKHQHLLMDSCHPKHCKASMPFSQVLRLRRICSEDRTQIQRTHELKQSFSQDEQYLELSLKERLMACIPFCRSLFGFLRTWKSEKFSTEMPARKRKANFFLHKLLQLLLFYVTNRETEEGNRHLRVHCCDPFLHLCDKSEWKKHLHNRFWFYYCPRNATSVQPIQRNVYMGTGTGPAGTAVAGPMLRPNV